MPNKPIHTTGVVIFRENTSGEIEVLLVRHGKSASHLTGTYGFPAGRLEEGDANEIERAIKELFEETGLTTNQKDLVPIPRIYEADIPRKDGTIKRFTMKTFVCNNYKGELKSSDETTPEWIKISKLNQYNLNANTLNMVQDGLKLR